MEVVRLAAIWDFQDPDAQLRDESRGDDATGTTSRIIAHQHRGYVSEVLAEKNLPMNPPHSSRNAATGSIRVARRAGR